MEPSFLPIFAVHSRTKNPQYSNVASGRVVAGIRFYLVENAVSFDGGFANTRMIAKGPQAGHPSKSLDSMFDVGEALLGR